jgi:PhnB protein
MANINSYLTFSGNCREAMTFYKECLGGDLYFQTIGESPMSGKMPQQMKDSIMHSSLTSGDMILIGSDMVMETGLVRGNSVSLLLNCKSEEQISDYYEKLSAEGKKDHPLENTFWGALFGDITDKFGNHWLLNYDNHQ